MRYPVLLLALVLIHGCGSKSAREDDRGIITRQGVIIAREDVDLEDVRRDPGVKTSVYASVSSGGNVSIGLGFLLSPFISGQAVDPVRYTVRLEDESEMIVYHDSRNFEIDDCVEIKVYPDEEKKPPTMRRKRDGC